jgi:hypothetical protein
VKENDNSQTVVASVDVIKGENAEIYMGLASYGDAVLIGTPSHAKRGTETGYFREVGPLAHEL